MPLPHETSLLGLHGASLDALHAHRPQLVDAVARFISVLFDEPAPTNSDLQLARDERLLFATHAAWLESNDNVLDALLELLPRHLHALATSDTDAAAVRSAPRRLRAIYRHIDLLMLRPAAAQPDDLRGLLAAGVQPGEIVEFSQIVSFISFLTRLDAGLAEVVAPTASAIQTSAQTDAAAPTDALLVGTTFTMENLAWHAWLQPVTPETGTPAQVAAFEDSVWPRSPYFRLLAFSPALLRLRTEIDQTVFLSEESGLPRGERELAAAVTSRLNGCALCASVHARFTAKLTGRDADVRRLLEEGAEFATDVRWRAITDAAAALQPAGSPASVNIAQLTAAGIDRADAIDVIAASAFFSWANRLMLSLGSPSRPSTADAAAIADQQAQDDIASK